MPPTVNIDELQPGMFVHLDLGWWAHPFALSSFVIISAEQIAAIRGLGLKKLRWSPEKSQLASTASGPAVDGPTDRGAAPAATLDAVSDAATLSTDLAPPMPRVEAVLPACADTANTAGTDADTESARHRAQLAEQRQAERLCAAQLGEARQGWLQACAQMVHKPELARDMADGLTRSVMSKLLDTSNHELCVRVLADLPGDAGAAHALNVMVVSLMVGKVCGLEAAQMHHLGLGALLHDIGKLALSAKAQHVEAGACAADLAMYRSHVALGVTLGQRMGLGAEVLQVLAQHHEMADGSGFPRRLRQDDMGQPARIVALINRYDNLCNPHQPALALTPHEALAALFAQSRSQFDLSVLNSFIRMMGVYPPGSTVQLSDERFATVVSVNPSRPLKPRVLVCDLNIAAEDALLTDLDHRPDLGIRRSVKPQQLPAAVRAYLQPQTRMVYFFEPLAITQPVHELSA